MTPLLRMEGISKRYGGVRALDGADLECASGRIHAVLGENGAGKSTLIKILAGVVKPDAGTIALDDRPVVLSGPAAANRAGIASVFQELSLLPDLTVADNIGIADPPRRWGLIDQRAQRRLAEDALARVGVTDVHPLARVRDLPLSRRQMVEIAKALARAPKILILDEATSALAAADVASVFGVLRQLRDRGLAIIFISHRMHEIAEIADDCSVYRNGCRVSTFRAGSKTPTEIVEMMIGRDYRSVFPPRPAHKPSEPPALKVTNLSWAGRLRDIDLEIRPGEVVGLGGLDGQGQRELLLALFGALTGVRGTVAVDGEEVVLSSPLSTRLRGGGIALVPEDRKTEGLMLSMSVRDNLSFAAIGQLSRLGVIDRKAEEAAIASMIQLLRIRADGIDGPVAALSGGNQQKVVMARALATDPNVLVLIDPTAGVDVKSKEALLSVVDRVREDGKAVLVVSGELDDLRTCDRVLVMFRGRVAAEFPAGWQDHDLIASVEGVSLHEE